MELALSETERNLPSYLKIRDSETLVVSKLDCLGRDALDVLQLGGTDIISPAGKMLMSMQAAVAEMERARWWNGLMLVWRA